MGLGQGKKNQATFAVALSSPTLPIILRLKRWRAISDQQRDLPKPSSHSVFVSAAKGKRTFVFAYPHVHVADLFNYVELSPRLVKLPALPAVHHPWPQRAPPPALPTPTMEMMPDASSVRETRPATSTPRPLTRSDTWSSV
jgi:hypothetical protein